MHQEIIKGGDKTSLALWEGDCVSWFLWQPACMANKIFPPTWVTAGCILQTQHGVNKHVFKDTGTNSRCGQIFGGVGEYGASTGLHQNLMPKGWNWQRKGASQHCILTTRTTGIFISRCLHHHQRCTGSAQGQGKTKGRNRKLQFKWHPGWACWEMVG